MISKKIIILGTLFISTTLLISCTSTATEEVTPHPLASSSEDGLETVTTAPPSIPEKTTSPISTPQPAPTSLPVDSPTVIPISTSTVTFTPTPTSTATPTPMPPDANFSLMCSGEHNPLEEGEGLTGVLAYVSLDNASWPDTDDQTGIIGGTSLHSQIFPPFQDIEVIGFSSDGDLFAFAKQVPGEIGQLQSSIHLISSDGKTFETPISVPEGPNLYWFGTWISNELIMVQTIRLPETGFGSYSVVSFSIYDAFTGEKRQDLFDSLPDHAPWLRVYFSPDMTRAVYFSDPRSSLGESIILWDVEKQTILWKNTFQSAIGLEETELGNSGFDQTAFWAPDSSAFVFTTFNPNADDEHRYSSTLVNRDGADERLLISSPNFENTMVLGGLWSPNGRFIYYFFPEKSYIYDLAKNEATQLCSSFYTYFAWSPNSESIAYREIIDDGNYLVVYDIFSEGSGNIGKIRSISGLQWIPKEGWLTLPSE